MEFNIHLQPLHTFHIPVMGLAYTIDSPIKVARFGISSVMSIGEDRLIEMMRKHYYPSINKVYKPISVNEVDYRAKRITDYLNLVNTIVQNQVQKLQSEAFEPGSEIVKYFEMLPDDSSLKRVYYEMLKRKNIIMKNNLQAYLRTQISSGSIDVNIMTKPDKEIKNKNGTIIPDGSDAVTALRGFMNSSLNNSSVVFSAGMNPRLYNYLEKHDAFYPNEEFCFNKKITIKVSDYRSALIQGKYLAKKGIWVSEFRIESGLNCGGHAFATDGLLLGPILEEFKLKRDELKESIFEIFKMAIFTKLGLTFTQIPEINISVQGGIGTFEEDKFLRNYYNVSSIGWGTPFLLVPEATTVDDHTLACLKNAKEKDIVLSNNSPLGVRFYYLKGTTSDFEKQLRIEQGKPGSPCLEKHLETNTEFTKEPICTASRRYQKLKLAQLETLPLTDTEYENYKRAILDKECLCVGLSNAAAITYNKIFLQNMKSVNVCPGPNIVNFSEIVSLQKMTDHIYGRTSIIKNKNRPHLFLAEFRIYINFLKEKFERNNMDLNNTKTQSYSNTFINNLFAAIEYYKELNLTINNPSFSKALHQFEKELVNLKNKLSISLN